MKLSNSLFIRAHESDATSPMVFSEKAREELKHSFMQAITLFDAPVSPGMLRFEEALTLIARGDLSPFRLVDGIVSELLMRNMNEQRYQFDQLPYQDQPKGFAGLHVRCFVEHVNRAVGLFERRFNQIYQNKISEGKVERNQVSIGRVAEFCRSSFAAEGSPA